MESELREGGHDPALTLIETLLWDGTSAQHWPLHLERLRHSAARLGWTPRPDPELPHAAVTRAAARLRLTLDRSGRYHWQIAPAPVPITEWRIGLSPLRMQACDPWLSLKTNRRAAYDASRAALPPGLDEVIFANSDDEVTEGTITNLFFDRGDGLRTPPLAAGVLPGVLRRHLDCPEERLPLAELPHVRLWLGNSLRGLSPAQLLA